MQFRTLYIPLTTASKKIILQHCIMKRAKENIETIKK